MKLRFARLGGINVHEGLSFSVLDIETTGLFPGKHDRIIEIAIVNVDSDGNITGEFETLINPNRDLGPTHIHKISAKMVISAPTFQEVAGNILDMLAGKIVVGHNVNFDLNFIKSEFASIGVDLPRISSVCTLGFSRLVDVDVPSRKLEALCNYFGVETDNFHCAYSDCSATAKLFKVLIEEHGHDNLRKMISDPVEKACWPTLKKTNKFFKRSHYENLKNDNFISKIIERLPNITTNDEHVVEYLYLMDEILSDRIITLGESNLLFELAQKYNISQSQARFYHKQYLENIIRIALIDNVITESENADIKQIAKLLDISSESTTQMIDQEMAQLKETSEIFNNDSSSLKGKSVCFTGTLTSLYQGKLVSRDIAQKIAQEHGLVIKKGVTKDLDYLVTADPDSMSGKAKKAREYNTKILAEQAFWNMLNVQFKQREIVRHHMTTG